MTQAQAQAPIPQPSPPAAPAGRAESLREAQARLAKREQAQAAPVVALNRVSLTPMAWLGLLATTVMTMIAWAPTARWAWGRYFPMWDYEGVTGWARFGEADSYYTHGPLVPVLSAILAFWIYRRVGLPILRTRQSDLAGWTLLLGCVTVHCLTILARVYFLSGFCLLGAIMGLILLWGGWPLVRAYWLPVALLAFAVPLPMDMVYNANFHLKMFAGRAANKLTNMLGVVAIMDGHRIHLPDGPNGEEKVVEIAEACGGLRSLVALTFFGAMFSLVCRVRGPWRLLMLALSFPAALACNVLRIAALNLIGHHYGMEAAGEHASMHGLTGMAMFGVAIAFMFTVETAIIWLARWLKKPWTDARFLGFLDHIGKVEGGGPPAFTRPGALAAVAVAMVLTMFWSQTLQARGAEQVKMLTDAVFKTVVIDGQTYQCNDQPMDELTLRILEHPDYLNREFYVPGSNVNRVSLTIVFSKDNRKAVHPPDICLAGDGWSVESKVRHQVALDLAGRREEVAVAELVSRKGKLRMLHLYLYKCGDRYTDSFYWQQATVLANNALGGSPAGALIRVSLPIHESPEASRKLGLELLRQALPEIAQRL